MVRKSFCLVLAVLILLSFAACKTQGNIASQMSQNTSGSTLTSSETTVPAPQPQTITLAHCQGEWAQPILNELVNAYKQKSGNTVELNYVPAGNLTDWSKTQFAGNTAPDLIWNASQPATDYFKNKWIIDLASYYNGVSPYTEKTWKDSFREGILDGVVDANQGNAMLGMPMGVVTVNLFYNKDIFSELGLPDQAPQSWSQVLEYAKKAKESGKDIVPYSVQNSIAWNLNWQEYFMMESLWYDVVPKLDIITPNGKLDVSEQALGVKTGVIDPGDQRMVDYFKFMKEFAQYFNKGFNTASWEYEKLFNEGKAAMNLNGSWFPNQCLSNGIKVNYGIGPMPFVDSSISKSAENRLRKYSLGMGGNDIVVTQKSMDEKRTDAAVDFLRYLSDPASGAKLIAEKFMFIPVVNDVEVPEVMKGITDYIGTDKQAVAWAVNNFTPEENDKYKVMLAAMLTDKTTPEEMAKKFKALAVSACEKAIKDHPEWKVDDFTSKVSK